MVSLKEPKKFRSTYRGNKRKLFKNKDEIEYELSKYDKLRMQLYILASDCEDAKKDGSLPPPTRFYDKYKEFIEEIENNEKYQPRKRRLPCCQVWCKGSLKVFLHLIFIYIGLLIVQLTMLNLLIIGVYFFWAYPKFFKFYD